ncbi:MAG: hypothetical protein SF029_12510, partial [bacterium]|nr:hypothetical protein [bacterium]
MPNETLIQQIETLRETYTRQQKSALGLQAALKTRLDSQSRLQKALADYGEQNTGVDVAEVQSTIEQSRLKEDIIDPLLPQLRRELKVFAVVVNALKDAASALRVDPIDVVRLDKAINALGTVQQQSIINLLPELHAELEVGQRSLGDEFGHKLR